MTATVIDFAAARQARHAPAAASSRPLMDEFLAALCRGDRVRIAGAPGAFLDARLRQAADGGEQWICYAMVAGAMVVVNADQIEPL